MCPGADPACAPSAQASVATSSSAAHPRIVKKKETPPMALRRSSSQIRLRKAIDRLSSRSREEDARRAKKPRIHAKAVLLDAIDLAIGEFMSGDSFWADLAVMEEEKNSMAEEKTEPVPCVGARDAVPPFIPPSLA